MQTNTKYTAISLFFQEEPRFRLFTRNGNALTVKRVKPICTFQQVFQSTYCFGAFSPITAEYFTLELPHCDSSHFQVFLDQFYHQKPAEFKIIVLDNGAFHKAKSLTIPPDIAQAFLPPYSPDLNTTEKIWWLWEREFTNMIYKNLEEISDFITEQVTALTTHNIFALNKFDYILFSTFWATL